MTYFAVLALFIGPPLAILAALAWRDTRRGRTAGAGLIESQAYPILFVHVAIAVIYTTPWDNYLVATNVWWYNPQLVTGLTIGWVPIEEYTFFVVQTLLTGLWLLFLSRYVFPGHSPLRPSPAFRAAAAGLAGLGAIGAAAMLVAGWRPGTYLGLELSWALVPIAGQLAFGADILWTRRRLAAATLASATLYLCTLDFLAIGSGTWVIDPAQSTGILLGGVLPLEELIFFLLTNTLIVFGMVLMLAPESRLRAKQIEAVFKREQRPGRSAERYDG